MTKKNNATMRRLTAACLAVIFALLGTTAFAASIDRDTALAFATNWLAATDNPLGADISSRSFADITPLANPDGSTIAWVLSMNPKGFLVLAADDRINPVVMMSAEGSFENDPRNPAVALLAADLNARLKALAQIAPDEQTRGEAPAFVKKNQATWQAYKEQTRSTGNTIISDIWVDVLVKTRWSQEDGIYNYYTPHIYNDSYSFETLGDPKNICTGCVATGTGQILRYFQWPQKEVGDVTGSCTIIYLDQNDPSKYNVAKGMKPAYGIRLTDVRFRGGDGNGGAYKWDLMTEIPSSDDSVRSFQQIGALLLDAGLSVGMTYDGTVPEAGANFNPGTIQSSFQYQFARGGSTFDSTRANLDARRPVAVSISSVNPEGPGHAIICDGYGKMDGRWYYHMNMGWGGKQDYWYNFDENFGEWSRIITFDVENIYRQPLQKNELSGGKVVGGAILSGRVTDSQGNPVSGVKVKLQKNGEDYLSMLAWYDPIDPVETPVYRDWDQAGNNNGVWEEDELPGAEKYRNGTDANGIWAIDKVANGTYTLVFEKDGLNFMGVKEITVSGAANQWGLNLVATPLEELAVTNAWKTGNTLNIKFNHAVGNVQVNPAFITVGGNALNANLKWHVSPSSDVISIEGVTGSGALVLKDGALVIDVDGAFTTDQEGMNDVPVVKVVFSGESGSATIGSAAPATSKVTGIALKNTQYTKANELVYKVTGSLGDLKVGDFKVRVQSTGKPATFLPRASIVKWDASSGELTVRAQDGEAHVFVDYIPEDTASDASYISTTYYTFDDCGPAIIKADLDYSNTFVTIEWNENVEGWINPIAGTDLNVILHNNGGTITSAQIDRVTTTSGAAITGPVSKMRVYLKYNPSLEVALNKAPVTNATDLPTYDKNSDVIAAYKVPAGVECVEVVVRENKVFDSLKNAASTGNTTQPMLLFASNRPRLVSAVMGYDNYSVQLVFNKRIYGIPQYETEVLGIPLTVPLPPMIEQLSPSLLKEYEYITNHHISVKVNYNGSASQALTLNNDKNGQNFFYTLGSNCIVINFATYNNNDNRAKLDVTRKSAESITITFTDIVDKDGNELEDKMITVPLRPKFKPGRASMPPPMFTNAKDSYDWIEADTSLLLTKAGSNYDAVYQSNGLTNPSFGLQNDKSGLIYYGIWYRDLDGDGRVDAVDLNYHNPEGSGYANLYAGSSAKNYFRVWVHNGNPDGIDNEDEGLYSEDNEGVLWDTTFPGNNAYPLVGDLDSDIYKWFIHSTTSMTSKEEIAKDAYNFSKNWTKVDITGCEVVIQNQPFILEYRITKNAKGELENNSRADGNGMYSVLRLHLKEEQIKPRTNGDRFIMVAYTDPREVADYGNHRYDGRMTAGAKAPTKDVSGIDPSYYKDDDEKAGVYWYRQYTGGRTANTASEGRIDNYFIAGSFGPAVAWDGCTPVPVSATAWRTNPYPTKDETETNTAFTGYEYLDVTFSEPIAFVNDQGMSDCGYNNGATPAGALYGAWGAELIDERTVRFKVNKHKTDLVFSWDYQNVLNKRRLFDLGGGFWEHPYTMFNIRPVGVRMLDSRYKLLSQDGTVDMFQVDAQNAHIDSIALINTYFSAIQISALPTTTFPLSVNKVEFKTLAQGGDDWTNKTAKWLENGTALTNATAASYFRAPGNKRTLLTYSMRANDLSTTVPPGSSVYGILSSIVTRNDTYAGSAFVVEDKLKKYFAVAENTFNSPDPLGRGMGFSTANTPKRAVMSGPVYNMVKVSALKQQDKTSRIYAGGKTYDLLGIDIAGKSTYGLKSVTVRAIDTSFGQFDPTIDLEKLADGDTSGIQLYDVNNAKTIQLANGGGEWSEWKTNEEGMPYREITLRPLVTASLPAEGGAPQSFDFYIRVKTSTDFNLGDSFILEIPDDGISIGEYSTVDAKPSAWAIPNGTMGFPFTDYWYFDNNQDKRWAEGDPIVSLEDPYYPIPLYDGGKPQFVAKVSSRILEKTGDYTRGIFYAKKEWATNPETNPFATVYNISAINYDLYVDDPRGGKIIDLNGTEVDLNYNTSYAPGDMVWYEVGGTFGVYDAGIDIPIMNNANEFPLPWQVSESGSKSGQVRGASTATASSVTAGEIAAPTAKPAEIVGLNMQDSGRGFGPRYVLDDCFIIETISKNLAGGTYTIKYFADGTIAWNGGDPIALAENIGGRVIVEDAEGTFIVIRTLLDKADDKWPASDITINFTVSDDIDSDIMQPAEISGVRIIAVGRGNKAGKTGVLTRNGTELTWNYDGKTGTPVDVAEGGIFTLEAGQEYYIMVQVSMVGASGSGSESEELSIYSAEGRAITPFLNISGLEIMAVSDMVKQGWYHFNYNGAGVLSWGTGAPADVSKLKAGTVGSQFQIVYGEGENTAWPLNYIVVRRNAGSLPAMAVSEALFVNQNRLFSVDVTIRNISGFSSTHINEMSNDENSGISLWWDANADGKFNDGDMFVPLVAAPVLAGGGNENYTTTLTPDPKFLTAWLSCPQDSSFADRGHNFFVCVKTTDDMSYGDKFSLTATFYEPSEPDYETGGVPAASATGTVVCTSVTNTSFASMTTPGQTLDAGTAVPLASIDHFLGEEIPGQAEYISTITIKIIAPTGSAFDPKTAFTAIDAEDVSKRSIVLYADDGDGIFNKSKDTAVPCDIEFIPTKDGDKEVGPWTYVLRPSDSKDENIKIEVSSDSKPDHFLVFNLADTLPYGVSFQARMETDAVEYTHGPGSAADYMVTDLLSSSINSKYADLLDSSMVTATSGLVVNTIGKGVASAYHNITFGYDVNSDKYTLTWSGNTVTIDMKGTGTYILGSGDNFIEVTFDPAIFYREDTLVCSDETGRPSANIKLGVKLTSLAEQGLTYYDANANGKYDDGETIAFAGALVYGDDANVAKAVSEFTAASGLSFWDEDEDGAYTAGESIFRDTDLAYTLPWMALLVDSDNYVTAGYGGAAAGISTSTALVNASTVSVAEGETLAAKALYLYYVDRNEDGLGYVYGEDIIVARTLTVGGANAALAYDETTDHVVFDPAYDKMDDTAEYASPLAGGETLCQFSDMDYLTFRAGGNDTAAYEQGDSLFLSTEATYVAPTFTWTIRVNKDRKIRWYNANEPTPYNTAEKSLTAVVGLDIANSGATDVVLTSLKVRFVNERNFAIADFRPMTTDTDSGVQLWRDMDGNGIFNPDIDKLVTLKSEPKVETAQGNTLVTFSPTALNEIVNENVDGIYDFFVVVQPSETANNKKQIDDPEECDQFSILIRNTDVVLNKTLNKVASLTSGKITIDSRAPQFASEPIIADTDQDGCIETLQMVFDEKLRPGMLDDTSIWYVTDASTGNVLTVTSAILSDDYLTVTLTFSGADTAVGTGPVAIIVQYNAETALLDWAGNAVEFRKDASIAESTTQYSNYLNSSDTVTPLVLHTGMAALTKNAYNESTVAETELYFHDRNGDGVWTAGEDVWSGNSVYDAEGQRVWNGGDAWTTVVGYTGVAFTAYYCDANKDGAWNVGEFLWIDANADTAYTAGTDTAIPIARTEEIEVLDTDANGKIDAILVRFSESLNDATMAGYDKTQDAFTPTRWSLTGYADFKACRQGVDTGAYADGQNDAKMYFIFTEGDDYDTDAVPALAVTAGETLADPAGNKLNGGVAYNSGTLVLADHSKPILVSAASDTRVLDGKLAADTTITLTFSEPLVQFLEGSPLADFTITKDGATAVALADVLEEARGMYDIDGNVITLTFVDETDGWGAANIALTIAAAADTVLGDAVGNNIQSVVDYAIDGLEAADPLTFVNPAEGQYIRTDDDRLAVQIHFGEIDTTAITAWTVGIYAEDTLKSKLLSGDNTTLSKIAEDDPTNDLYGWLTAGVYEYKMVLTLTTEDGDTTYECNFFASAEGDVFDAGTVVNDGQVGDTDEILIGSATLYANWTDFAAANGLPAAASYTLSFALDGTELGSVDVEAATGEVVGSLTGFTWPADAGNVVATVTAFDADGNAVATATSNGATLVDTLTDKNAPEIAFVNNTKSDFETVIRKTAVNSNLYAAFEATDDTGIASYKYRLVRGAASIAWSEDEGKLNVGRRGFGYAQKDGKLYLFGGFNGTSCLASMDVYDASTRLWTAASGLNDARQLFGFASNDAICVVAGGTTDSGVLDSIEVFNFASQSWSKQAVNLSVARYDCQIVAIDDNRFWVIGGTDAEGYYLDSIEQIDFTNTSAPVVTMVDVTLSQARSNFKATLQERTDGSQYVVVIGGENDFGAVGTIDLINIETLATSSKSLATERCNFAAVNVPNANGGEDVWVIGGQNSSYQPLASVEVLKADGTLGALANMNMARRSLAALWIENSESVLVVGGFSTGSSESATFEMAPKTGASWTAATNTAVATGHALHALALVGTEDMMADGTARIVAFSGTTAGNYSRVTESRILFDVLKDWTEVTLDEPAATATGNITVDDVELVLDETYVFEVKVTDVPGNESIIVASAGVKASTDEIEITATIACDKEIVDGIVTARNLVFTIAGDGVTQYKYSLDGGANWSEFISVEETISKYGLADGTYTLLVCGKDNNGNYQDETLATSLTFTVQGEGIAMTFEPALTTNDTPNASTAFTVTFTEADDVDLYKYELFKDGEIFDYNNTGIALATALELGSEDEPLEPAYYTLKVYGHHGIDGTWDATPVEQSFEIAVPTLTFSPELAIDSTDTYDVSVELNGLGGGFEYQLDGGEVVTVTDTSVNLFTVGPLETGAHTLLFWAIDSVGVKSAVIENAISVTSTQPIGAALKATLTTEQTYVELPADLTFTLSFDGALMNEPEAAHFTIENGEISEIAAGESNSYTITVTPADLAAGVNQQYVSLSFNANSVYHAESGNGNKASETVKVLVYSDTVISFELAAFNYDGTDIGEAITDDTVLNPNDLLAVKLTAKGNATALFQGGELKLTYDTTKFEFVGPTKMVPTGNMVDIVDPETNEVIGQEEEQMEVISETAIDPYFDLVPEISIEDGVITMKAAIANPTNAEQLFATIYFKAIAAGEAADTDFAASIGEAGILVKGVGALTADDPIVAVGTVGVNVAEVETDKVLVTFTLDSTELTEGGDGTNLNINLAEAIEDDATITIGDKEYTLEAGVTGLYSNYIAGADIARDYKLTGDRTQEVGIKAATPEDKLTFDPEDTVTLTIKESDFDLVDDISFDGEEAATELEIEEGEVATVVLGKFKGLLETAYDITYDYTIDDGGVDYSLADDFKGFVIAAGEIGDGATVTITTNRDYEITEDKQLTITFNGYSFNGTDYAFDTPVVLTLTVKNIDALVSDFSGDGVVDDSDLQLFLLDYGNAVEDAANPDCDLDGNGVIDFSDLMLFLLDYNGGTRGGYAEQTRSGETVTLSLRERSGKTIAKVGDVLTIDVYASTNVSAGIGSIDATFMFDVSTLAFNGEFNAESLVNTTDFDFSLAGVSPKGNLDETAGTLQLSASDNKNVGGSPLSADDNRSEVLFASFTFKVTSVGEAAIGMASANCTAYPKFSNFASGNYQPLTVELPEDLVITIGEGAAEGEFTAGLWTNYAATRGDGPELQFGMKSGASVAYNMAEGDTLANDFAYIAKFVEEGRTEALKWDIRGITEDTETYNLSIVLPAGEKDLTLDWSKNGTVAGFTMPDTYTYTMVVGNEEIDMKAVTSYTFEADAEYNVSIIVAKIPQLSQTYELLPGWNLIGVPFVLDADSTAALAAYQPMGYNADTQQYVEVVTTFEAGKAYWVFAYDKTELVVTGTPAAAANTALKAGWNLVTPLYGAANLANPADGTNIPTVWYWEETGYKYLDADEDATIGTGYWLNTTTDQVIW